MAQHFDAVLKNADKHEVISTNSSGHLVFVNIYTGFIYDDARKRFPDGSEVRTSRVEKEFEVDGVKYIKTLNTIYKLQDE